MPGRIVRILAAEGEEIQEGQALLVLEAMKMQNEIKSPQAGRLTYFRLKPGDHVETGALLFSVE
jgi:biotin carboxyl carrier protein